MSHPMGATKANDDPIVGAKYKANAKMPTEIETKETQTGRLPKYRLFYFLYVIMHIIGISIIILMFLWTYNHSGGLGWSNKPSLQFNWHPLLMTIGMVYLYANSILIYRGFRYARKWLLKTVHSIIFVLIVALGFIALWAVYEFKELTMPNPKHYFTLHSWLGLTTVCIFVLQYLGGVISFLCPFLKPLSTVTFLATHRFFELTGYVLATATALLGLLQRALFKVGKSYPTLPEEAIIINTLGVMFIVFSALVVFLATNPNYKRLVLPIL